MTKKKMTKFDIIKKVHEITGISYKETGSVINNAIEVIKEGLKDDSVIELRGFGTFRVAERAARIAYKPKGRERLEIPEKRVPVFKPVKSLKDKVDKNSKK